jgi:tellurite resistance protein
VALAVWGLGPRQLALRPPPPPLRPILAIHLAPASLLGLVAAGLGWGAMAQGFAALGGAILLALLAAARWLTAAGFSALWAAFTFPLAAWAALALAVGWTWAGGAALLLGCAVVPWIALRVLRIWPDGTLAARTGAAAA